ncbi:glycosyltransferase [Parapedobacter sp. 10938]|uniref:glycosyltransferase n=1 Tax=Parapedobacter flavus TaxID=3110225 RepID=UPI002DBDD597|nr:glycosyltransferase [Parapedobacter sp. 10938]MEC3880163.1 glycosyltransferase [Parapedobacter sp. 10938]
MADVSIVIPTFNDKSYLEKTLNSILNSSMFQGEIEIIVIDNGSTDGTVEFLSKKESIIFLHDTRNLNSPYSCRNRGIEAATGSVIILLDATCVPHADWLKNGVAYLIENNVDVVGGDVLFDFEGELSAAKIFDSLTNIRMKESIENRGVAKTANLFIKKNVFEVAGLFPEGVRSGADVRWTHRVSKMGLKIRFCRDSIVYKPARGFKELIKKQWRVGLHQPLIWRELSKKYSVFSCLKKLIVPVSPVSVRRLLRENGTTDMQGYYLRVWFVAQFVKSTMAVANIVGILRLKKANEKYH